MPLSELVERFPQWQAELAVLLDCDRLLDAMPAPPAFPESRRAPGRLPPPGRAGPGGAGPMLPRGPALALVPTGRPQGHARRSCRAPVAGPPAAHAHRAALLRARVPASGGSGRSACPTSAGRRWPGSSTSWAACRRTDIRGGPSSRSSTAASRRARGRRPATARRGGSSPRRPMSARSAGSAPAWPTPSSTPTTAGWSTWTSSRRTSC